MLVDVGAALQKFNQVNSIQGGQQGIAHTRSRVQETESQAMEVDQSHGLQRVVTGGEQETGRRVQATEANQDETQVSDVSPFPLSFPFKTRG